MMKLEVIEGGAENTRRVEKTGWEKNKHNGNREGENAC